MGGNRGCGRKRKPTELKVLEGSFRKDRDRHAPLVSSPFPGPPDGLSASEEALWAWFPRVPWIGESDVLAVQAAVSIYDRIRWNHVQQREAPSDEMLRLVRSEEQLWGRLMSILASLGLTPADRAKMSAPKANDAEEDKWAGLL